MAASRKLSRCGRRSQRRSKLPKRSGFCSTIRTPRQCWSTFSAASCRTTIASAILEAYKLVGFSVPLVVRLEGTEVAEGRKLLSESKLAIISAEGLTDAAKKVVAAAGAA